MDSIVEKNMPTRSGYYWVSFNGGISWEIADVSSSLYYELAGRSWDKPVSETVDDPNVIWGKKIEREE